MRCGSVWSWCLTLSCCRDLSGHSEIQTVILDSFSSHNEEVKAAASYALGKSFSSIAYQGKLTLTSLIVFTVFECKYTSLTCKTVHHNCLFIAGNVSVGNLPKFLPFVLKEIENQPKRQYLLLHSLKEVYNNLYMVLYMIFSQTDRQPILLTYMSILDIFYYAFCRLLAVSQHLQLE